MTETEKKSQYIINPSTLVIMPEAYGGKVYSKVLEYGNEFIVPVKPIDLIKRSCEYFCSTYEGRRNATKLITNRTHKLPIAISPQTSIYFFPTHSPKKSNCIWVSSSNVETYQTNNKLTDIVFKDGQTVTLPVSHLSFQKQVIRTISFSNKVAERLKVMNTKKYELKKKFAHQALFASEEMPFYSLNPYDFF